MASIVFVMFVIPPAHAVIGITEIQQLDFGILQTASAGSESITVPRDGSAATGTGTVLSGTPARGQFTITGSAGTSIDIDIQNVSTGSSELTLDTFQGIYDGGNINVFPQGGLGVPGAGKTLYLGAKLTYTNLITDGSTFNPSFDIVINYE